MGFKKLVFFLYKISTVRLFEIVRQFPNPQRFAYEVIAGVTTRSLFLLKTNKNARC